MSVLYLPVSSESDHCKRDDCTVIQQQLGMFIPSLLPHYFFVVRHTVSNFMTFVR